MFKTFNKLFGGDTPPVCLVAGDGARLAPIAQALAQGGARVELCASLDALVKSARSVPAQFAVVDLAFGMQAVTDAIDQLASIENAPPLQPVSPVALDSYELVCAAGQLRLQGDARRVKVLPALQPPYKSDDIKKIARDHGLVHDAKAPRITLAQAIKHNWLELWYQPKIELANKRLSGAEGLIRVRHPEKGVIFPGDFLPGANEADMLCMTEYVIHKALRDWEICARHGVSMKFAVNVPVSALTKLPIANIVKKHRPKSDQWPGLILEVTEDEIVNDLVVANEAAESLRVHHCTLAIDDFGAGYSSLGRLRQLPFSELKIDRSYVTDCDKDRISAGMCETIIELAHRFGLKTVAEGIETTHESHKLQGLSCDVGQGYLFAKPMELEKFTAVLRQRVVGKPPEQPQIKSRGLFG